jgi:hypothetical protein
MIESMEKDIESKQNKVTQLNLQITKVAKTDK